MLAAAATARQMLRFAGEADTAYAARTGAWTAVLTAALTSSAMIDPVMAKGEILGIPLVVTSFWLGLRALNRTVEGRADLAALALAAGAGFLAVLAQGLKQNLVAGLVFGVAMLVGARVTAPDHDPRCWCGSASAPWPAASCRSWRRSGGRWPTAC